MAQQSLTPRQAHGQNMSMISQKLRQERRILGDLSNTQCQGSSGGCGGGEKREASGRPKREAFRVFTGGENAHGAAEEVQSSEPTSVRWSDLAELGLEELPAIDCFANSEPPEEKYWKPLWEGGPADPMVLAQGFAETMDLADLEAQRMDVLVEGWQTPKRNQDLQDLDLPLPSPPSISPFRMEVDATADDTSRPVPRCLDPAL